MKFGNTRHTAAGFIARCDAGIRTGLSKLSDGAVMAIFLLATAVMPFTKCGEKPGRSRRG